MIIPLRTDSPLRRTPYMNCALIAANFVVFFIQIAHNGAAPGSSSFVDPLILRPDDPRLWQYFTYAFLHANWLHIIGNMLFLYIFGNNINDRMGHVGYLAFYLAGAVFAGIGYVVVEHQGGVLGASGAVAAVTGAYLVLLPRSNITILFFFYLVGTYEIPSLWFILFFFAQDVVGQIAPELFGGVEAVAHMAHIAGTLFGATLCCTMLAVGLLPRDQFDIVALVQRWNRRRQYRDMVSHGYNPFAGAPVIQGRANPKPQPPDPNAQRVMEIRSQINQAISDHDLPTAADLYQALIQLDPNQVLARTAQLDMANFLASQQRYEEAAAAYERFARFYPKYEQIEQVHLMLGIVYGRYLHQPQIARENLIRALSRLHRPQDIDLAQTELRAVETSPPPAGI
jgi:membrane associated rhomboid family serine protease